jgi:DNA-binding transcriptional ArsR family regulator
LAVGAPSKHDVFQAIADPTRRSMLKLLAGKEMAIAEIVAHFPVSRTAVNKHLYVLSDAGLVRSRKVGRETRYRLQPQPLQELKQWLAFFDQYWDEKLANLKDFVESDNDQRF